MEMQVSYLYDAGGACMGMCEFEDEVGVCASVMVE